MRAFPLFVLAAAACAAEPQSATNERLCAAYDPAARTFTVTDVRAGRTWRTLPGTELPVGSMRWRLDGAELVVEIDRPPETPQTRPIAFPGPFRAEKGDRFILHGKGWGHGVGLCQIGAAVMGEQGKTYDEILLFYYRNAKINQLYE